MLFNLAHTFAVHHEKSSVPVIFQVSFDHQFDNLESGKINSCFGKKSGKRLEFWIQKPCVMYDPYNKSPKSVTITNNSFKKNTIAFFKNMNTKNKIAKKHSVKYGVLKTLHPFNRGVCFVNFLDPKSCFFFFLN